MSESFPQLELQKFISGFVHSVEQLEILCLLAEAGEKLWTAEEVFRCIQSSQKSVSECLKKFTREGFLVEEKGTFRFSPKQDTHKEFVLTLARAYRERRVTVVEMIYRKPEDSIQHFADAFRWRKDK